jgi:hypothetical protein
MKTKLLKLTLGLFSVAAMSSPVLADPSASRAYLPGSPAARSSAPAKPVMNDRCKSSACCGTVAVATAGGGRATRPTFKNVVTCKKVCPIVAKDQHAACRKGMRA